jgi:hypothetical protein
MRSLFLLLALPTMLWAQTTPNVLKVQSDPALPVNGSPILFTVRSATPLSSLSGTWMERRVFFNPDTSKTTWVGLAGVDLATPAAPYPLLLEAISSESQISESHLITIGAIRYPTEKLRVRHKFLEPDAKDLIQIEIEQRLKKEAFERLTPEMLWSWPFVPPTDNIMTSRFGVQRTFNGVHDSVHRGLDFRAAVGTPVGAMNDGIVVLARKMFYEGGFLVLDHGQGLFSMYMHLSQLKSKEGDRVAKNQTIALSGKTGRVTDAHLDCRVRWQGIYVNPEILLKLNFASPSADH